MKKIKLYNSETEARRRYFAAVLHEIFQRQHPGCIVIEPANEAVHNLSFQLEGTEHVALISDHEVAYIRSYLGVSTSPETGIFRRLNRIRNLPRKFKHYRLSRVVFALAIECPRACLSRVDEIAGELGNQGIQFELWEAKDVRQQIAAHLEIRCPAFEQSHLLQLGLKTELSCPLVTTLVERNTDNKSNNVENDENENDTGNDNVPPLGTLFVSYASEDRSFVENLISILDRFAAKMWYDRREIVVGDSIMEKISTAISKANTFVVILSTSSVKKPWVLRELNAGLGIQFQTSGISILPVLIEPCELPSLLVDIKYADFTK